MPRPDGHSQGEAIAIKGRLQEAVTHGYPDAGWEGDPHLKVVFNQQKQEWQVWDNALTPPTIAVRKEFNGLRDLDMIPSLCKKLADAEVKKHGVVSIFDRIEARNAARHAEAEKASGLVRAEAIERLGWAIRKDMDAGRL